MLMLVPVLLMWWVVYNLRGHLADHLQSLFTAHSGDDREGYSASVQKWH